MRFNTKVHYAALMMATLASQSQDDPVALKDISLSCGLPKLYLAQLTGTLKNANLLKSVWGNKGGFKLGRPASAISLRDVFEAAEGPIAVLECVDAPGSCSRSSWCKCRPIWQEINAAIVGILEKYSVDDLKEPELTLKSEGNGSAKEIGNEPQGLDEEMRAESHWPS